MPVCTPGCTLLHSLVRRVNTEEIIVFVKNGCPAHPWHGPGVHTRAKNERGRKPWILGSKCRKMPVCTPVCTLFFSLVHTVNAEENSDFLEKWGPGDPRGDPRGRPRASPGSKFGNSKVSSGLKPENFPKISQNLTNLQKNDTPGTLIFTNFWPKNFRHFPTFLP